MFQQQYPENVTCTLMRGLNVVTMAFERSSAWHRAAAGNQSMKMEFLGASNIKVILL